MIKSLSDIRAAVKKKLKGSYYFSFAKKIYVKLKFFVDKRVFKTHYPDALYLDYSRVELKVQHEEGFFSQYGQDFFLWNHFLKNSENNFFVDIGANDPVINSNSYFLERSGWTGVAIDPILRFEEEWKQKRTCQFFCGAVAEKVDSFDYVEMIAKEGWEHAMSGFKECVRPEDLAIHDYIEYQVNAKPLKDYINLTQKVGVLMIDVEGAEMQVLQGIDLRSLQPDYVMVENIGEFGGSIKVREYMERNNYTCIARIAATDDLFRNNSIR